MMADRSTPSPATYHTPPSPAPSQRSTPSNKTAKFDIGNNCFYEGEIKEYLVSKYNPREALDLLFEVQNLSRLANSNRHRMLTQD